MDRAVGYDGPMTPLRSFRRVPIPSPMLACVAVAMWGLWWAATRTGFAPLGIEPVEVALLFGFLLRLVLGVLTSPASRAIWAGTVRIYGVLSVALVGGLLLLVIWLPYPDAAQIAYTLALLFFAATKHWFVIFSPQDLHRMPNAFAKMGTHLKATQTMLGLSGLVTVFTSAALIRLGNDAAWMAFITGGALLLQLLTNWIIVLWMLSQTDETDA